MTQVLYSCVRLYPELRTRMTSWARTVTQQNTTKWQLIEFFRHVFWRTKITALSTSTVCSKSPQQTLYTIYNLAIFTELRDDTVDGCFSRHEIGNTTQAPNCWWRVLKVLRTFATKHDRQNTGNCWWKTAISEYEPCHWLAASKTWHHWTKYPQRAGLHKAQATINTIPPLKTWYERLQRSCDGGHNTP